MNKHIEELSKPVAWFTDDYQTDKSATTYSIEVAQRWAEKPWSVGRLYSQEYVDALLAKLEAAEKLNPLAVNVSELESTYIGDIRLHMAAISDWKQRAEAAEARLLVPVKLPKYCERYHWSDGVFNFKEDIIEAIRKAGYPVEGDE